MSRLCRLKTAKHGDDGKWAYEEITKLREQVSEIAAAKHLQREVDRVLVENHKLRETIKAQAAVIEFQKKALKTCEEVIDIVWVSHHANRCDDALEYAREALAIPTDSTQILAEVRKQERERCAKVCEELRHPDGFSGENVDWCAGTDHCAEAIRAME